MQTRYKFLLWGAAILFLAFLVVVLSLAPSREKGVLGRIPLADGRIIQIEGISYGTEPRIGHKSVILERFGPWLPAQVRKWLDPQVPESSMNLDEPAMVVWVNALDANTGTNIDCQSIRLEFVDNHGDLFGTRNSYWFGGQKFWRLGHSFPAFPRDEKMLTLRITTLMRNFTGQSNSTGQVELRNPFVTRAARWSGRPLPQSQKVGDLEIALTALRLQTNGSPQRNWETPARYWEPVWEIRHAGRPAGGWSQPEWIAEDALGNRAQYLGEHQPVLRYTATIFPMATNSQQVEAVLTLPAFAPSNLTSDLIWNQEGKFGTNKITVLGILPAGSHSFSDGNYLTNPPAYARFGPVRGGAASGWVGSSRRSSPTKLDVFDGHYSPSPAIYLRTTLLGSTNRLAVRLRDEQGRSWVAKPEPQGYREWIMPYLLENLPPDATNLVPEVVVLKPVRASFTVETGSPTTK